MCSKTQEYPVPEQPIDSQQPTQPFVDLVVEPSHSLVHPTLVSKSDPYVIEPMSCLVNPTLPLESEFHEAVELIPLSINPTLLLESEVSASHIFFTASSKLTEQEGIEITSDQPPPSFWICFLCVSTIFEFSIMRDMRGKDPIEDVIGKESPELQGC